MTHRRAWGVGLVWAIVGLIIVMGATQHHMSYQATTLAVVLAACTLTLVVVLLWATGVVITTIALFHDDVNVELLDAGGRVEHMLRRWRAASVARHRASSTG